MNLSGIARIGAPNREANLVQTSNQGIERYIVIIIAMRLCFLILIVLFAGVASAASVREQSGNIYYVGEDEVPRQLTSLHTDTNPILAPDGQKIAFLRAKPKRDASTPEQEHEIWWTETSGKNAQRLLEPKPRDAPENNLSEFNSLVFSTDGNMLYFLSAAWATSNALHVLNLSTGKEHFITDADDVLVMGKGKFATHLIVMKHKYFKQGGSFNYYWLMTPKGKEIKMVGKDREQAERFIREQE
jgi:hypothetical protein